VALPLRLPALPDGVYLLHVSGTEGTRTAKVVLRRH
jgi:hypothetical protein